MAKRNFIAHCAVLSSLAVMLWSSTALSQSTYSTTQTVNQGVDGQDISFLFSSLPTASSDLTVIIGLQGDYSYFSGTQSSSEGAEIIIDNQSFGYFIPAEGNPNANDCDGTVYTATYTVPAAWANNNNALKQRCPPIKR